MVVVGHRCVLWECGGFCVFLFVFRYFVLIIAFGELFGLVRRLFTKLVR